VDAEKLYELYGEKIPKYLMPAIEAKRKISYSGFIAQEVEKQAQAIGFDFSGVKSPKNEKDTYGLRYAEFVVPLVKSTQELYEIIQHQQRSLLGQDQKTEKQMQLLAQYEEELRELSERLVLAEEKVRQECHDQVVASK